MECGGEAAAFLRRGEAAATHGRYFDKHVMPRDPRRVDWPHAPLHRFDDAGVYFVTGATLHKKHFYRDRACLDALLSLLFRFAREYHCVLQAWALFSNHYHLVVSCAIGDELRRMLTDFHTDAAIAVNHYDGVRGRTVWYQFRETLLTYERSWLARLRYTHENAVHHGLVQRAASYPWCSARWFEDNARPSFVETVRRVPIDRVRVYDEFAAAPLQR